MSATSHLPRTTARPIRTLALVCTVLTIAGCTAVGPDYRRPATALPSTFPAAFPGEPAADEAIVQPRWWTLYGDATLTALVDASLARNADVRLAAARVEETEAVLAQARAAMFPEIDLQGSSTRARSTQVGAVPLPVTAPIVQSTQRLVLSTTFEIDFWGRLRRADEAARAQALGTRYGEGVVATTLAGATAQSYFALRSIEAQAASLAATVTAREGSLDLARRRAAGGVASDLDVAQANGALADARVQLRELQRQRAIVEHQLAVLTGQPGAAVPPGAGIAALPLVPVPPAGLPSSLLDRRPDVRQAEQTLASASALIGVAKAQGYPTFSLTAFLGGQAADLGNVISGAGRVGSLGASVFWPVFDAGRYRARTREAEARAEQAAAAYERTVQTAWREVADALDNVGAAAQSEADVEARLRAARETLRISQIRYDAGYSGYLEVLDAQRTLNGAELASIQNRQARLAASVDLMKTLGGGWQLPAATGAADGARPGGLAVAR
jgi:multidrug efflux system outer membrane protein